jgi:flagellar export protein FliJ
MDGRSSSRGGFFYARTQARSVLKRFQFPLDAVKRLRAYGERQAQAELGRRMVAHEAAERAVAARTRTLESANARLRARSGTAASLVQADRDRSAALLHVENANAQRDAEQTLVDGARVRLAEARQQRETLERLEDSRRREHREAVLREEEALLADVVQARAARRAQLQGRA